MPNTSEIKRNEVYFLQFEESAIEEFIEKYVRSLFFNTQISVFLHDFTSEIPSLHYVRKTVK